MTGKISTMFNNINCVVGTQTINGKSAEQSSQHKQCFNNFRTIVESQFCSSGAEGASCGFNNHNSIIGTQTVETPKAAKS